MNKLILSACFLLSGCLYTTHHFNSGRILEPGQTAVTMGYGNTPTYTTGCSLPNSHMYEDSAGVSHCQQWMSEAEGVPLDSVDRDPIVRKGSVPKVSFGYRLGVRGPWGPFTGLEMGWQLEVPTNPMSAEFDLKFGLPFPGHPAFRHSLSAGWIVGMWADNSWFSEYAVSRAFGGSALYGNYRLTYLATQSQDLETSLEKWHFQSHQQFIHQAAVGFYWKLPDIVLLPDFLSPQVIATFPVVPPFNTVPKSLLDDYEWNLNFGFGWSFR